MKKIARLIFLLLFLLDARDTRAETRFTNLNQSSGLRSGDVMCFLQDTQGFMWIGTKSGLNAYDGTDFDVYGFDNTAPFNSDISALQAGTGDEIWIGTMDEGLYAYNISERKLVQLYLADGEDTTRTINSLQYWNKELWVGTDRGLFRVPAGEDPQFFPGGPGKTGILDMAIHHGRLALSSQDGSLYLVHRSGLVQDLDFSKGQINAIQSLDEQHLLLGTQYAGLYCISTADTSGEFLCHNELFPGAPPIINEILVDRAGTIWVGTDGEGLFSFTYSDEPGHINNFRFDSRKPQSITSNAIFSLFEDEGGLLWIGSIWKGLSILDLRSTGTGLLYSDITGDDPYPVLSLYSEEDELWVGTDGKGLNLIREGSLPGGNYNSKSSPALSGDYVQHISRDTEGLYWIGTFSSGLNCLDRSTGRITSYINQPDDTLSISYNDVRMVLEDGQVDLWIATWGGGLNHFDRSGERFSVFSEGSNFSDPSYTMDITSICWSMDHRGLWVGTFGHGLFYFDTEKGKFTQVQGHEFEDLKILCLRLDDSGYLWMGTWGKGPVVYSTIEKSSCFSSSLAGLGQSRITAIEEDRYGKLWFSSKNGIWNFNPADSSLIRQGSTFPVSNKEFHINASCRDDRGNLYFGGLAGVVKIRPELVEPRRGPAPPAITNIYLFNKNLPEYQSRASGERELKLNYNQNFITFSFSSPVFPISDVAYTYRLEGFSDVWVPAFGNMATFPSLPPGKYVFSVRSSLQNPEWSAASRLRLTIAQPYWKAWYAYMVYIAIFVTLLFLFYKFSQNLESARSRLKLESLKREQEQEVSTIKQRFFTNISHEIRTPVTLMLGATNRLLESGFLVREHQKEIAVLKNSSRHLLSLINELLDFRRLESGGIRLRVAEGDFHLFTREIYLSFQSEAISSSIDYRFISREETISLWFDRDQLEKVLYNLVSNAFKYTAPGGMVSVEVDQDDQFVYLKVSDSGTGVPEDKLKEIFRRFYQSDNASDIREQGFGLGLSVSHDIVKMHGGEIYARNNEGEGITISAKLPRGSAHLDKDLLISEFKSSEYLENYRSDKLTISTSLEDDELSGEQILIVEDNHQLREYLEGLFAGKMKVLSASNGEEGLQIASLHIPDIIVSDVMMPVMDGVSMTKALKTGLPTSHIPVILLTARTNLIFKKEGYEIGADDYITKPFNEVLLKTRVMSILRNRRKFREKLVQEYLSKPKEELNISSPDQKFLQDLTAVLEQNIEEQEIRAALISSELGMSHSVVYKKVKGLTGLSLIEFIRDFKLKRAAVLLEKYQLNISEVCYRVGFSDRRYFSRLFKSKYGMTPSEFARSN